MPDTPFVTTFPTPLGWMALLGRQARLCQLTFGAATPVEALARLQPAVTTARHGRWNPRLVERLRAYAAGHRDDFRDVQVDLDEFTEFQRRVLSACRQVGFGATASYAQLAAMVGSPAAARAVGQVMRRNPVPLVIPCHRILGSNGLGGYSGAAGLDTKRGLLALEAQPHTPLGRPRAAKRAPQGNYSVAR